jgi:S-adenosyl-L-methionine hydrolase (adenosine-forming)
LKPSGIVTLLTDFGLHDGYVAVMKGVIMTINPGARLVDITHLVEHGSVPQAADLLMEASPYFPEGTIHLAVVDPGVGGKRRPIALEAENRYFVGPDNGLFWPVLARHTAARLIHLTNERYFLHPVSPTFHGRDIFAPVAAYLSLGQSLAEMGEILFDPIPLKRPEPQFEKDRMVGEVVRVDHFGNLITNILEEDVKRLFTPERAFVKMGTLSPLRIHRTYSDVKEGDLIALFGSGGRLEVGVNLGRACDVAGKRSESPLGLRVEVLLLP